MSLKKKGNISLVFSGIKSSPFLKAVDGMKYSFNFVFNNALDFTMEHPDPGKRLSYHLELFHLLDKKVCEYKSLHEILQTLSNTFEPFNPLKMPLIMNLLGRYAAHLENRADPYSLYLQIAATFNKDQYPLFPLFREVPSIVTGNESVQTPLREYILGIQHGLKAHVGIMGQEQPFPSKVTTVSPRDLHDARLCDQLRPSLERSLGIVIVPTDVVSLHYIFSCNDFTRVLDEFDGKITLVSPFWAGNEISGSERDILSLLGIPCQIDGIVGMVKDHVDTIVVRDEDSQMLSILRETGRCSIITENLSADSQCSEKFFDTILKTLDIERETLRIDVTKEKETISEDLTGSLKRFRNIFPLGRSSPP